MEKRTITLPISRGQLDLMEPSFNKALYEELFKQQLGGPKPPRTKRPKAQAPEPPRRKGGNRRKGK